MTLHRKQSAKRVTRISAALPALLLAFSTLPLAAQGGKKPGGSTPPPPFRYQVTWVGDGTEANRSTYYSLRDVAPDGTVVGSFTPGGVYGENRAIVRFPDGVVLNLETFLISTGQVPSTWRVKWAWRISRGNVISLDIYDDAGTLYTAALKLDSLTRSLEWFKLFPTVPGTDAFLSDASEDGNFLIASGEFTGGVNQGINFSGEANMYVWNPISDSVHALNSPVAGGAAGWFNSAISDYPAALITGKLYNYQNSQWSSLPNPGREVIPLNVGDNGTVVAEIAGEIVRNRQSPAMIARLVPGSSQWQTIVSPAEPQIYGGRIAGINATGEIAGTSSGNLFLFHDTYGLLWIDNLIDTSQPWNASGAVRFLGLSDSGSGLPGNGAIIGQTGQTSNGSQFILTPVAQP